ncbi:DUF4038 domain-containing protein [Mesorhizobium sp. BR1-1-16]|uniref:apiosidase-like domain-containing protein n=1 Tax=Mesorhizobium sp. BR1-1-16 TaxID=2876653 RepID=UPI001CCA77B9|nr:DUF4038 domain-containing protein [Mesorhizobium sp. BR1-1-16]MBZ9938380.1 DUF4038 domain-containing protein [Mesorhizobium sp. BR1-1-16]
MTNPSVLPRRSVGEWQLKSTRAYKAPFADVRVDGIFTSPSGKEFIMPGFHDGDGVWKLRFNPGEAGRWTFRIASVPHDPELAGEGSFDVEERETRGFLKATPGKAWGFHYENGEPVFFLGDTVYDLFGMAYCGGDVEGFLKRRQKHGFNLFRCRLPISRFHPPEGYSDWHSKRLWPWGGSETSPRFDIFNLDYFRSVDETVALIDGMGMGIEMIMEGWGFEFPFNHRAWFTPEWEELWMRYLIARYDAYAAVHFWTPLNEYEYYPNGDWHHKPAADRWALWIARWIKRTAPHGHVLSMHNGPVMPPFAERFHADPEAVDAIMFQEWGARDRDKGWLATGIEEQIEKSLKGWGGSAIFAEWGYERNPDFYLKLPSHEFCDRNHTRRSAWRGVMSGLGIIAGFENSWAPWMELGSDQPGVADLDVVQKFFRAEVPFADIAPANDIVSGDYERGTRPLALANADRSLIVVYFPAAGDAWLDLHGATNLSWFDPRTGAKTPFSWSPGDRISAPPGEDDDGHPLDAVLVARR